MDNFEKLMFFLQERDYLNLVNLAREFGSFPLLICQEPLVKSSL